MEPYNHESKFSFWEEYRYIIYTFMSLVLLLGYLGGCANLNKKLKIKDDHIAEELLEELIEEKLGIDIDLTPRSLE